MKRETLEKMLQAAAGQRRQNKEQAAKLNKEKKAKAKTLMEAIPLDVFQNQSIDGYKLLCMKNYLDSDVLISMWFDGMTIGGRVRSKFVDISSDGDVIHAEFHPVAGSARETFANEEELCNRLGEVLVGIDQTVIYDNRGPDF